MADESQRWSPFRIHSWLLPTFHRGRPDIYARRSCTDSRCDLSDQHSISCRVLAHVLASGGLFHTVCRKHVCSSGGATGKLDSGRVIRHLPNHEHPELYCLLSRSFSFARIVASLQCRSGQMGLSEDMEERLIARYIERTRTAVRTIFTYGDRPQAVGGSWHCPGCSSAITESSPGVLTCLGCGQSVVDFVYHLRRAASPPMTPGTSNQKANKTDAGNGSKAICRVSNVLRSPSPDPQSFGQETESFEHSMGSLVTFTSNSRFNRPPDWLRAKWESCVTFGVEIFCKAPRRSWHYFELDLRTANA